MLLLNLNPNLIRISMMQKLNQKKHQNLNHVQSNLEKIVGKNEREKENIKNAISRVKYQIKQLEAELAKLTDDNKVRWAYQPLAKFECSCRLRIQS